MQSGYHLKLHKQPPQRLQVLKPLKSHPQPLHTLPFGEKGGDLNSSKPQNPLSHLNLSNPPCGFFNPAWGPRAPLNSLSRPQGPRSYNPPGQQQFLQHHSPQHLNPSCRLPHLQHIIASRARQLSFIYMLYYHHQFALSLIYTIQKKRNLCELIFKRHCLRDIIWLHIYLSLRVRD